MLIQLLPDNCPLKITTMGFCFINMTCLTIIVISSGQLLGHNYTLWRRFFTHFTFRSTVRQTRTSVKSTGSRATQQLKCLKAEKKLENMSRLAVLVSFLPIFLRISSFCRKTSDKIRITVVKARFLHEFRCHCCLYEKTGRSSFDRSCHSRKMGQSQK